MFDYINFMLKLLVLGCNIRVVGAISSWRAS